MLPILVGLVVVALIGAIAALAMLDDPQDTDPGADPPSSAGSSSSSEPSEPTDQPSTEQDVEEFVRGYVQSASSDPAAGFAQLTESYQEASGGLEGYRGFWGNVSNPQIRSITVDTEALTVTYDYRYNFRGQGVRNETVSLRLVPEGDGFLIDGTA